ncbi:ABC transporter ATP-binding protein [Microbacterium sp. NPDC057650]|uniref:ABC transporter ATP-binding protein n=1 Tax=unclassified Microbacterium TaxID=2609290 RepID=UPI00366BB793
MTAPMLELRDVHFRRGGRPILRGITISVRAGERWALLGPNGAGKSTILGFCGALTHPSEGTVDVLGHRIGRVDLQALRRRIGHVNPRHPLDSPLSATQVVLTGLTGTVETPMRWSPQADEVERAQAMLDVVGLGDRREANWFTMSQGERGRVLIARALVIRPDLLLLDEPTTGLDVAAREQFLETVDGLVQHDPGMTSILVTHHLEELPETTTHALVISDGEVVSAGPVDEVLTTTTITHAFRYPIEVMKHRGRWSARAGRHG